MKPKPLGCLTRTGILAALFTLLAVGVVSLVKGNLLFSPGALSNKAGDRPLAGIRSHAETGGRCALCHTAPWDKSKMSSKCLACHVDLDQDPKNFHRVMLAQSQQTDCYSCHPEHKGPDAPLTIFNMQRFPHNATGFSLNAHQNNYDGSAFTCSGCHPADFTNFDQLTCAACHLQADPIFTENHVAAFGKDCLACHDGLETYGKSFDHQHTEFPLEGKHAPLSCSDCHAGASVITALKDTPQDCYACHAQNDQHQGDFGQDCAQCHTPQAWDQATFDHNLVAFQLVGKHATAACQDCHANNVFKGTPQDCYACHSKDDPHQGGLGQICAQCHTPNGWDNVTYDHSLTSFQLTGAHLKVECQKCHINNIFKGTITVCSACHNEPAFHLGLLGTDCQACHNTSAWYPATFNSPHNFPLNHGGGSVSCKACHPSSLSLYTCFGCHEHDPNSIAAKHREEGIDNFQDCVRCHPTGQEEGDDGGDD